MYIFSDTVHGLCCRLEGLITDPRVQWVVQLVHVVALHFCGNSCPLTMLTSTSWGNLQGATHVGCMKGLNFSQNLVACLLQGLTGRSRGVSGLQEDFPFHYYQWVSDSTRPEEINLGLPVFYQKHWSLLPKRGCICWK